MDYCHPCQRHLNGALACAGCGTPAEALGPYAIPTFSGHEPEPSAEAPAPPGSGGRRRRARAVPAPARRRRDERGTTAVERGQRRDGREPGDAGTGTGTGTGTEIVGDRREASAGREPRSRRGHRRRGRGVLLGAIGVVLALGALSLAELAIEPEGDDGAADFVSESTANRTEPAPGPSVSVLPEDPGPVESPVAVPANDSHTSGAGAARKGPTSSPTPGKPGESESASAPADTSPSASSSAPPGPDDTEAPPADPSDPGKPSGRPTQPEPPEEPDPTPSPTETCTQWLWFCT